MTYAQPHYILPAFSFISVIVMSLNLAATRGGQNSDTASLFHPPHLYCVVHFCTSCPFHLVVKIVFLKRLTLVIWPSSHVFPPMLQAKPVTSVGFIFRR